MAFKGTKGKWEIYNYGPTKYTETLFSQVVHSPEESHEVANCTGRSKEKAQANAQLVAMAPEMFELLNEMQTEWLETGISEYRLSDYMAKVKEILKMEENKQPCNHDFVTKFGETECQNCGEAYDAAITYQLDLGDGKVFKFNDKPTKDLNDFRKDDNNDYNMGIHNMLSLKENEWVKEAFESTTFAEGKKLFLEVEITDSFHSRQLISWLHGKSKVDGKQLEMFGCKLNSIHYQNPFNNLFSEEEKQFIINLAEKLKEK